MKRFVSPEYGSWSVVRISTILCLCWIVLIFGFLAWEINGQNRSVIDFAMVEARASYNKDLVYRRWSAGHGGTYVPATSDTPPSPYLSHISERDIITPSGRELTLINPAYMTRQVHELAEVQYGVRGHITSLNPIRPENRPDSWEAEALKSFEQGEKEVCSVSRIGEENYLRLISPMVTEERCLKCHAEQGYQVGDLRGGISVSVPIAPYMKIAEENKRNLIFVHALIGIVGLAGLVAAGMIVRKKEKERSIARTSERRSSQRFYAIFEQAAVGVALIETPTGQFRRINRKYCDILGYSEAEMKSRSFMDVTHPDDLEEDLKNMEALKSGRIREFTMEKRYYRNDGTIVWVSLTVSPMWAEGEKPDFHIAIVKDITERKQAEFDLYQEFRIHEAVADISRALMSREYDIKKVSDITLASALHLTDSNHGFASSINRQTAENVGHTLTDMFGDQCRVKDLSIAFPMGEDGKYGGLWGHALNTKKAFFTNTPGGHPSATGIPEGHIPLNNYLAVPVVMEDTLLGMIALANAERDYTETDITVIKRLAEVFALAIHRHQYEKERIRLETSMRRLQKNEAIGALAGGIAHDFNNILFPIVGYAEILSEDLGNDNSLQSSVDEILTAANRARELVRQILTFSRQSEQEAKPLKPHLIVKEVVKLVRATIPSTIEIRQDIDSACRTILADPTQVHQVVMNLITNAYHAMAENGGSLTIRLKNTMLDGNEENLNLPAGSFV
ncbi:MAG: PAS domain S-box protein, partial [Desulfobacterales bacterium]|nr:PAS domain S-box protein [Desulfobacterales bacterium]